MEERRREDPRLLIIEQDLSEFKVSVKEFTKVVATLTANQEKQAVILDNFSRKQEEHDASLKNIVLSLTGIKDAIATTALTAYKEQQNSLSDLHEKINDLTKKTNEHDESVRLECESKIMKAKAEIMTSAKSTLAITWVLISISMGLMTYIYHDDQEKLDNHIQQFINHKDKSTIKPTRIKITEKP